MDFFIYDQNGILVRTITEAEGPFTNGYYVRIEKLPEGNYQVVSLGNIYSDNEIRNVEQLSTALISLVASNTSARSETSKGVVLSTPTTLFHALTDVVNVKTLREVTHSTDLVRNTNDVTVTLNWKDAMGNYCTNSSHETETVVYLEGNYGESDFGNNLLGNRL